MTQMKSLYKKYVVVISLAGQFLYFAQFYDILINQSAKNVSLVGFMMGLLSAVSWLGYGIMFKDKPLIITQTVATIGALLTVTAILIYR